MSYSSSYETRMLLAPKRELQIWTSSSKLLRTSKLEVSLVSETAYRARMFCAYGCQQVQHLSNYHPRPDGCVQADRLLPL